MTETGRPYGGTNQPDGDGLPGERQEPGQVGADPSQSPRAAQGPMSDEVTRVPENGSDPDGKKPGVPDATGPQG